MNSNSPDVKDSSALRHLPQSYHFHHKMGSPGSNMSPYSPHRGSQDYISFRNSSPMDNRRKSHKPFKQSSFVPRHKFNHNRSNYSSPDNSFNSSRNSSFNSPNSSFNSSQGFSPFSQRSNASDSGNFENSESYRSMFGNPWVHLESNLKKQLGDKLQPLPDVAVYSKLGKINGPKTNLN